MTDVTTPISTIVLRTLILDDNFIKYMSDDIYSFANLLRALRGFEFPEFEIMFDAGVNVKGALFWDRVSLRLASGVVTLDVPSCAAKVISLNIGVPHRTSFTVKRELSHIGSYSSGFSSFYRPYRTDVHRPCVGVISQFYDALRSSRLIRLRIASFRYDDVGRRTVRIETVMNDRKGIFPDAYWYSEIIAYDVIEIIDEPGEDMRHLIPWFHEFCDSRVKHVSELIAEESFLRRYTSVRSHLLTIEWAAEDNRGTWRDFYNYIRHGRLGDEIDVDDICDIVRSAFKYDDVDDYEVDEFERLLYISRGHTACQFCSSFKCRVPNSETGVGNADFGRNDVFVRLGEYGEG